MIGYSDADWAGNISDRKLTSGYLFQMSGGAVNWRSKSNLGIVRCRGVALSTSEAEYMALYIQCTLRSSIVEKMDS